MIWKAISGIVIALAGIALLIYILLNEVNREYGENEPKPYYGYFRGLLGALILIIIGAYFILKAFDVI